MTPSSLAARAVAVAVALVLHRATAIAPAFASSAVATSARGGACGGGAGSTFPPPPRRRRRESSGPSSSSSSSAPPLAARGGDDSFDGDGPPPPPPPRRRRRTVLVTGGAGYIGSHTCLELLATGRYRVVIVDNLVNSDAESLNRVRELLAVASAVAKKQNDGDDDEDDDDDEEDDEERLHFRNCDIRDGPGLRAVLDEFPSIGSCVHFAGLKAVGESFSRPLDYYDVNVGGTTALLRRLEDARVNRFVFSSSATVYGEPEVLPLTEGARLSATNPYGRTKLFIEEMLRDLYASDPARWSVLILRYFNPIGAHPSGRMGEDPQGIPNNLMPFIAQVCVGRREKLGIFGNDYDTPDGTGVRDYIHVVDLAKGHVAALDRLYNDDSTSTSPVVGCESVNLGTGRGVSVLELVAGMAEATGRPVPYAISDRRPGDVARLYADATKAREMLGWEAELGTKEMCEDTWRWQSTNPMGYKEVVPVVVAEEVVVATTEN